MPPRYHTEEHAHYQRPFWQFYDNTLRQIGKVDVTVANGDLIDGPGEKGSELHATTNINSQVNIAREVLGHIRTKQLYIVRGTGYHTDRQASYEQFVAEAFNRDAHDELRLEAYGTRMHFRHVVGRSDIPYGQYTQVGKELINEILQAEFENYDQADLLARAHVHYSTGIWVMDGASQMMRQAFTAPGLQLRGPKKSSFTRGLRTWLYHVGVTLIELSKKDPMPIVRPIIFPLQLYAKSEREYICLTEQK
jgi:hypothetical protein